jgi:hypothetical protein
MLTVQQLATLDTQCNKEQQTLDNEELHNLWCCYDDYIKENETGELRNAHKILIVKSEGEDTTWKT